MQNYPMNYLQIKAHGHAMYDALIVQMELVADTEANLKHNGHFIQGLVATLLSDHLEFMPTTMLRDQVLFVLWLRGKRHEKLEHYYGMHGAELREAFGECDDVDGDPERQNVFAWMYEDIQTAHYQRLRREGKL